MGCPRHECEGFYLGCDKVKKEMINQYKRMLMRYYTKCDNIVEIKNAEKTLLNNGFSIQEICDMGVDVNYDRVNLYSSQRDCGKFW